MRKTSVYLTDGESALLAEIARRESRSQAEILRAALAQYDRQAVGGRDFAAAGAGSGPGDSIADLDADALLAGFGE